MEQLTSPLHDLMPPKAPIADPQEGKSSEQSSTEIHQDVEVSYTLVFVSITF